MQNIEKNLVRFIIPFSFELNQKLSFASQCQKILQFNEKEKIWIENCIAEKECDLYDAIQKTMQFSSGDNQGIGQNYRINPNCKKKYFPKLEARIKDEATCEIVLTDMGLSVFQIGIGFFWYEINIRTSDINEILLINNALKEMSHSDSRVKMVQTNQRNEKLDYCYDKIIEVIPPGDDSSLYLKIKGKEGGYLRRSFLPEEIQKEVSICIYQKENDLWYQYSHEIEFSFLFFILQQLSVFSNIQYFASREKLYQGNKVRIPDKAILFSFLIEQEIERKDILPYLYWLGKGYTKSYIIPNNPLENPGFSIYEPFMNSIWHACIEGCAQIVCKTENSSNALFFETTYIKRLEDYFYIYVLVLYQYYGLLKMDREISLLPNEMEGYQKKEMRIKLYGYKQKLNFFLMNSSFLRISHISHHNYYFEFLKKAYGTDQITALILEKVTLMNDMVEQWQQRKKNRTMLIFTITGGIFILIQTLNNILGIYDFFQLEKWFGQFEFAFISLFIAALIGFVIWICVRDWKEE
jgi:hypothetical protein